MVRHAIKFPQFTGTWNHQSFLTENGDGLLETKSPIPKVLEIISNMCQAMLLGVMSWQQGYKFFGFDHAAAAAWFSSSQQFDFGQMQGCSDS